MRISCPSCGSDNPSDQNKALIAPWLRELTLLKQRTTTYTVCKSCSLGWVDISYSDEVLERLYSQYRKDKYFRIRNDWEPTYTKALNNSLDYGDDFLKFRREFITKVIEGVDSNFISEAKGIVDIGGGHGGVIPDWPNLKWKYVLEVSDAEPKLGIETVTGWSQIPENNGIDLIMACGILEHLNSPREFMRDLMTSALERKGNQRQLFYFEVPYGYPRIRSNSLFGLVFFFAQFKLFWRKYDSSKRLKKSNLVPIRIAEHLQFFTEKSLEALLTGTGYEVHLITTYDSVNALKDSKGINFGKGLIALASTRVS